MGERPRVFPERCPLCLLVHARGYLVDVYFVIAVIGVGVKSHCSLLVLRVALCFKIYLYSSKTMI